MEHEFRLGDWLVRPHQNQIVRGGEAVRLDPRVMQVLVCLAERPGEVISQEQIIEKVSGFVGFPNYDISPDGETFVVVKRPPPVTEFNVVLNWFEELERRVPTR